LLEETHYYPYGLTIAGISINALKGTDYAKNRKEYNGIEHITDLDLNQYDAFFRTLDPQTGRWAQLDPKTESMEMWSPYASMYNNPIRYSDLLGDSSIAPNSGLVERVPYRDGDQTGLIINATEEERQNNPVGAAIRDFSHAGLTLFGLNAIDNFIANRFNPEKNDPLRILAEAGAVALATTRGEVVEGNRETGITELIIDGSKHPESAQHAQEAMDRGILGEGVVDRAGASARRRGNLRNVKTEKGKDRDEFPPAVLRPSGDVSVKNITSGDNRGAGSSLGHQQANVPDNTRVQIKVINLQIVKE
jgi:RHS repeat-associated protein